MIIIRKPTYFVPLDVAQWLKREKIEYVVELDWWQAFSVDPPEAVQIHRDMNSPQSIASHWGTFKLSDEPIGEPLSYLEKALRDAGLDEKKFIIMRFGETLSFR